MPVIGRLDEQVEDLIISPVSKRRDEEPRAEHVPEDAPRAPATPTQTPTADESSAKPGELPVWLL